MPKKTKLDFVKSLQLFNKRYSKSLIYYKRPAEDVTVVRNGETIVASYSDANCGLSTQVYLDNFIGSYIRGNVKDKYKLYTFIISELDKDSGLKLEIWPSDKIRYAYLNTNYAKEAGSLGSSCMRYKNMQKALNFYIKNGVEIVVLTTSKTRILGRALLWHNVHKLGVNKKYTYLDRVYYTSSRFVALFEELAINNKWFYYDGGRAGCGRRDLYLKNITVEGICHLPYADTFVNLYFKDGILTSRCKPPEIKHSSYKVTLTHTGDGGYHRALDPNSIKEALTDTWVSKKDCVFVKRYDGYVHKSHIVDIRGAYYSEYDKTRLASSPVDGWILKTDKVTEAITDVVIDKHNAVKVPYYDYITNSTKSWGTYKVYLHTMSVKLHKRTSDIKRGYVHKEHIARIHGRVYHKQDPDIVRYQNKYYHTSQCYRVQDWGGSSKKLIPKHKTLIAYDIEDDKENGIKYTEHYLSYKSNNYIELHDGTYIVKTDDNRKLLKRFNNKYYIKSEMDTPDKAQLHFTF